MISFPYCALLTTLSTRCQISRDVGVAIKKCNSMQTESSKEWKCSTKLPQFDAHFREGGKDVVSIIICRQKNFRVWTEERNFSRSSQRKKSFIGVLIVAQKNSILSTIWVRNGNYANVQKIVEQRNLRIELQEEKFILVHVEDSKNFLSVLVLFPQKLFASDYLRLFCDLIKKKLDEFLLRVWRWRDYAKFFRSRNFSSFLSPGFWSARY